MLKLVIYSTCFLLLAAMTYLLLKSSDKSRSTRTFSLLLGSSLLWISCLWVTDSTMSSALSLITINIAVFFFSLVAWLLLIFAIQYPSNKKRIPKSLITVLIIFTVIYLIAAILKQIITSITLTDYGASIKGVSVLYTIHILQANGFAIAALLLLNFKKRKLDVSVKSQIDVMTIGLIVAVVGNVLSGTVGAYIQGLDWLNLIGVLSTAIFIAVIGYAIIRHKMFDIRSVVFRALVYILSVVALAFLYTAVVYGVGGFFINIDNVSYIQRAFFGGLALIVAITYTPIIKYFNKITSKVFYRDAYDTSTIIDQIGKIIVGSIDLHKIQKSSLEVLLSALKPNYGGFVLKDLGGNVRVQDFVGEAPRFEIGELNQIVSQVGKKIVVYDELNQTKSDHAQRLRKNDISLIVPLTTKNEIIGYFITGPKKSGNIYNQQDKKMLTIAANELGVALQNAQRFEEIQAFNITLQEKVNEATRELKSTNKKLIALDEAKDEFISMASHQLRTPLTSIKGYLSMMLDGDMGKLSASQTGALKEAYGSSQRMVFLISDFLNVSRIRTGKFVIEPKEVNLATMISEEIAQLKEMVESKDINLTYDQPAEFPTVMLDDNKMRQVMMNIIDNALYYTPAGGTITIQLYKTSEEVIFKVIDSGIGVPKAEQHKLFTKFFRAGNARKARPDGTGLGLFMAQKVVVEQAGAIIFESIEGKGSTFGFRFPLAKIKA